MANLLFGTRNGNVDLLDLDTAMALNFGAKFDPIKKQFFYDLQLSNGSESKVEKVMVVYKRPEPTEVSFVLPAIIITRDSIVPAWDRLTSPAIEYQVPAPGSVRVSAGGQLGYSSYERKPQAQPYDISYTFECWARYREVAQIMLMKLMVAYPLQDGKVTIYDSLGVSKTYTVLQQNTADLTQISSMVERIPGFSLILKVQTELTLDRIPSVTRPFTGATSSSPIPGISDAGNSHPGDVPFGDTENGGWGPSPNQNGAGLYGTGLPILRVGLTNPESNVK